MAGSRLMLVSGKGGTGKSAVAAGIALLAQRQGDRVLAMEVDDDGSLSSHFATTPFDFEPREVRPGLHAMRISRPDALLEYLSLQLRIPGVGRFGGRIARAIAWRLTGNRDRATIFAARLGQGFAYAFIAIGILLALSGSLFSGVWLALIGWMLAGSARESANRSRISTRLDGLRVADVMDAEPTHKDVFPEPSIWPFLTAVATGGLFVGAIFTPWAMVYGTPPVAITLIGWFWPKKRAREHVSEPLAPGAPDPIVPEAHA